ncbi:PREDICTED: putative odorant receptor 92a [Bactrocera latifrons]|uniref:putative odorant receptor 92a n=1 Tax=Bactrocera latifrons TaxID=174628 RepID=UPI0008DEA8D0|nr:PREDICTED: putative odorant receptor 92a [Bactrocera latifrons]
MNAIERNTNFARFTAGPVRYLKFFGILLQQPEIPCSKYQRILIVVTIALMFLHQIGYILEPGRTFAEQSAAAGLLNYTTVSGGKILFLVYNRRLLLRSHCQLAALYPSAAVERHYKLEHYLRIYAHVQTLLYNFFKYILIVYLTYPIMQSFYDLWSSGVYSYIMPTLFWYPVPLEQSLFCAAFIILSADLCLFSSVSQLMLHLDLLAQRIKELQPAEEGSLNALKSIIEYHQQILTIAKDVNSIFAPSILFSLASSSFILCFSAYQLLDDVSFVFALKVFLLLGYEMKQVVITCYYGDKLMDSSANLFTAVYAHNWTDGSPVYKRLVLFMMVRTYRPIALNVAGISDVSLITLKQVLSTAYQIFTVLKTT